MLSLQTSLGALLGSYFPIRFPVQLQTQHSIFTQENYIPAVYSCVFWCHIWALLSNIQGDGISGLPFITAGLKVNPEGSEVMV